MKLIHVEIVVAGVVGVQDELLGGVGSRVEEHVLEDDQGENGLDALRLNENAWKLTNPIVK